MGLLNLLNKKNHSVNTEAINDNNENTTKSQNTDKTTSNDNANSDSKFRFVIQDIFNIEGKGCVVVGMVENSVMRKDDAVYVIKTNGKTLRASITGIELYKVGLIDEAKPDQNVGVFFRDLETDQLDKGDVIVNASDNIFSSPVTKEEKEEEKSSLEISKKLREDGIVTENRRNELGSVVFQTNIKSEMLETLTLQECSFILKSLEHFNEKSALPNYDANRKVVYDVIIDKIKTSNSLFMLFDKVTGQPFIGNEIAEVYSTKHWADMAVKHYEETYRQLYVENFTLNGTDKIKCNLFAYLFFLGMENLILDNGAYSIQFKRNEILPPPDWSGLEPINVPVTNPSLRLAVNIYLAEARWGVNYAEREENLKNKENNMLSQLRNGKFLIPIKSTGEEKTGENEAVFKKGGTISFALITNSQEKTFVPLFTDWLEFEKAYNKDQWKGMIITVKDALSIAKDNEGMVVNPFGENLIISNVLAGEIFKDLL